MYNAQGKFEPLPNSEDRLLTALTFGPYPSEEVRYAVEDVLSFMQHTVSQQGVPDDLANELYARAHFAIPEEFDERSWYEYIQIVRKLVHNMFPS